QAQWEYVKSFWNKVELEQIEENTKLSEKKLDKIEAGQQVQATENASNQINVIQNRFINRSKKRGHGLQVDEETSKRRQTRSGRVTIPDYHEETDEASSSDVSTPEFSSQENKPETMHTDESLSQESENAIDKGLDIIRDDVMLQKKNFSIYKEQDPDGELIDLRLNSPFFKKPPKPAKEWHCKIDDLKSPEPNDPVMTAVVRAIRRTLPQFIKAFSLEDQNPLLNISTIEGAYLNSFVHPCFDAFLWYIANVNYEYGEITSKKHVNSNRADGAGFMIDADKYQLVYVEGSRPVARDDKEIGDLQKITSNSKMFAEIVKDIVKNRKRLPKSSSFGVVSDNNSSISLSQSEIISTQPEILPINSSPNTKIIAKGSHSVAKTVTKKSSKKRDSQKVKSLNSIPESNTQTRVEKLQEYRKQLQAEESET
ncbi:3388_t:CDS:2, partial [Acaulospora colombiana]